ncbi:unnamed protein product, partial [Cuscuta epithymum]
MAMLVSPNDEVWHQHLGHASDDKLRHISHLKDFNRHTVFCDPCVRLPFSRSTIKTKQCFYLVHCDIWGGYKCTSLIGARYFCPLLMISPVEFGFISCKISP